MQVSENDRAVEASAVVGGERSALNERVLHQAIRERAAILPPPSFAEAETSPFRSFFMGGFECACHRRRDGRRLDLIRATAHDDHAVRDYRSLASHGLRTVRDGLRWHLIETSPGRYDWSSFLPMLRAARESGTQVIWDLIHWGYPDDLDIWSPAFVERFARFARAAATLVRDESDDAPMFVPVNEISFWSWAGGSLGWINPFGTQLGGELKEVLVRSAIAAIEAVRDVAPTARFVHAEPTINVVPRSDNEQDRHAAVSYSNAQFEALDMLAGRMRPELGGRPDYLDILGINYYLHNQWIDGDLPIAVDHHAYRPLRELLQSFYRRYERPIFLSETGIEGELRADWLRITGEEVLAARRSGVPVLGICLYPILDYPGWEDERPCPTGLYGWAAPNGSRPVHLPLAAEIARQLGRPLP